MKSWATFVASFVVFISHSRISAHPFQIYRSHHDSRGRISLVEEDPFVRSNMNWTTSGNQRVQVATLDINRGFIQPPIVPSPYPTSRTQRSQTHSPIKPKKHNCVQGFCEDVDNYPEALIKRVVGRTNTLDAYFREAEVVFDVNNRGAFDEEEDSGDTMCPINSVTLYPRTAKNTKQEDKILINVEGHKQGIVFETCLDNATCRFHETFPSGFISSCKQKYVKRSLAVLDGDNQNTAWDTFEVPSCCVCVIKHVKN